jgi:hypothetical protein
MTSLKDLKKPGSTAKVKDTGGNAAETSGKKKKKERKYTDAELKEQRVKNLKIRKKDPEVAAQEKAITDAFLALLKQNPEGLLVEDIMKEIYETVPEGDEYQKAAKKLRFLLRAAKCIPVSIESQRKKKYKSPA